MDKTKLLKLREEYKRLYNSRKSKQAKKKVWVEKLQPIELKLQNG